MLAVIVKAIRNGLEYFFQSLDDFLTRLFENLRLALLDVLHHQGFHALKASGTCQCVRAELCDMMNILTFLRSTQLIDLVQLHFDLREEETASKTLLSVDLSLCVGDGFLHSSFMIGDLIC